MNQAQFIDEIFGVVDSCKLMTLEVVYGVDFIFRGDRPCVLIAECPHHLRSAIEQNVLPGLPKHWKFEFRDPECDA